jgi:lipid II:glycine glycyltransferase (peptidoglycan interpeptide bridge formation enzyme)
MEDRNNKIHKRMKRGKEVVTKTIEANTFETRDLIKRLYRFDKIMNKARKSAGYSLSDENFQKVLLGYKAILDKFDEFEKLGIELKLDREQK